MNEAPHRSKLHLALWILGAVAALLLVFGFGVAVGSREFAFRTRIGENYFRDFYGMAGQAGFPSGSVPVNPAVANAHGATGKIIDVASTSFSMTDIDGDEFSVVVPAAGVLIREGGATIDPGSLQVGDFVAVIGAPNGSGQIQARFIRVFTVAAPSRAGISGAGTSTDAASSSAQ